jgi:hypothetical protein
MNTIEDRLREALRERAAQSPIDPDAWEQTRARSRAATGARGRRRWRRPDRFLIPAAAAAAVVAIVLGVTATVNSTRSAHPAPAVTKLRPAASPKGRKPPSGPFFIDDYPPVSALLAFPVTAPGTGRTAVAYAWLGYTSPDVWLDQLQGLKSCTDVEYPSGNASGDCMPLPQLSAGDPARVTDSTYMGASNGPLVLQGLAVNRVASVTAVLPGGQVIPGLVKTGRGFPDKAWAVVAPADEATYKPVSGVRLVFRDASGAEVATLSTAVLKGPLQITQPSSGGIPVFTAPKTRAGDSSVTAYLIDGYVGFFLPEPRAGAMGWMAPQLASGPPALAGLSVLLAGESGASPGMVIEAFGYTHADVARVVLRMGDGPPVSTSTLAAWPGSGLRLWAVPLWTGTESQGNGQQVVTATGYNAAGQAVAHVKLGQGAG